MSRRGKLFENGICVFEKQRKRWMKDPRTDSWKQVVVKTADKANEELLDQLKIAETILTGQLMKQSFGIDRNHETDVKYNALIDNPIRDIREMNFNFNDRCNFVTSASDPTFRGMFPNGDGNFVNQIESGCY